MMETKKLRRADFYTSIILILFGLWVLSEAVQMPMKGTYGGVKNAWYVSPALLPLIIGGFVVILGVTLLVFSVRQGGAADAIASARKISWRLSPANQRFLAIVFAFVALVYLYIPRIDFFLSIWLFLSYFIVGFYYDEQSLLLKLTVLYAAIAVVFLLLFGTGIADILNSAFTYSTDVVALVAIIAVNVYAYFLGRTDPEMRKRFRLAFALGVIVPLLLIPVFRFALLVPFPVEGGIVDLMGLIYFSLR